jgi:glycosyltransferase involved in cell wall biosynthesis
MNPSAALHSSGAMAASEAVVPLRQLHIYTPKLGVGGGELSLLRLAEALTRRGVEVTFVLHEMTPLAEQARESVGLICLETNRTLTAVQRLARSLRQHRPQALLSAFPHSNVAAVAAKAWAGVGCPLVLTEHAPLSRQVQHMGGWRYRAMPALMRWLYPRADAVVAVSEGVREDLHQLSGHRVQPLVIHNPVLPANLAVRMQAPVDHPWMNDPRLDVVMTLSRLSPEKDIPTLLRAFAALVQRRPNARLVIGGEGPEREALVRQISALGLMDRVALVGLLVNPFAWLAKARVFALASRFEGFGNVLVEAMACGAAVVSTDCPVGPREILADGRLGALVPVGDHLIMAAALEQALVQGPVLAARDCANGFTEERTAAAYQALLETLLNTPKAREKRVSAC